MHASPRTLRADIEDIPGARPHLTERERERQAVILAAGRRAMVHHGRAGIRLADLATALGMAPGTIRRYFPDLDYLLSEILSAHLLALSSAIGTALRGIAPDAPHRQGTARAAYLAATRTVLGGHTEGHLLLLRERHTLPDDVRGHIEQTRAGLGAILAGELGEAALGLLDMPELCIEQIEAMLRILAPQARTTPRLQVIPGTGHPSARAIKPALGRAAPPHPPVERSRQPYATAGPHPHP